MAQHPTEETLNITRKFLGGELGIPGQVPGGRGVPTGGGNPAIPPAQPPLRQFVGSSGRGLPSQAAGIAGSRAFGQQGLLRRNVPSVTPQPRVRPTPLLGPPATSGGGSLSDRFFDLPSPVNFAQTPQGRAILQRILGGSNRGGLRRF